MSKKKGKGHVSQLQLPDTLDSKEISFTNLLLLGFEPNEYERRHNIPFNRDMFVLPNKKAFEVVMHFLFERLNPAMSHEKFRDCWPICDKKQEQAFRRTVTNQLTEIAAEDQVANLPRIVPSLFMSPGGDRFYSLLLHFSQYVLYKVIKQENGKKDREILQRPKLLPAVSHLGHIMLKTTQAAAIRHRRRFLDKCQLMVMLHQEWKEFASELVKEHRSLTKELRDLEHDIRDCQAASYDLAQARGSPLAARRRSGSITAGERQVKAVKRTQKIQKVREMWKTVDALYVGQSQERDVVMSVLQEVENKYRLDAGEINVQVPEMLLRECQQEIQRCNIGNTYEGGKLRLLTLVQLWNLSLHFYLEKVQAPMPRFEELSPDLVAQVHTHHAHLANTQAIRSTLTNELLPELKKSVGYLRKEVQEGKTPSRKETRPSFQLSSLGLELLPPTPPVSFEPATGLQNETPTRLSTGSTLKNNTSTDTPEAVSLLSDTINKAALRRAGLVQGTPTSALGELRKQAQGTSKLSLPTSTVYLDVPDSMSGRKRVKSAPSKVERFPSQSLPIGIQLHVPSTPVSTVSTHRKRENVGPSSLSTNQTKKKLRGRQSLDGRKDQRKMEKSGVRKKPAADVMSTPMSVPKTPISRFKSDQIRSSSTKPNSRAQHILAEQIADAVTTSGKITPDFLDILRSNSRESSPIGLALENPLAGLDQDAFVSKDKLKRTPVLESNQNNSRLMETPNHVAPTGTLFESDSSPEQQDVIGQELTSLSNEMPQSSQRGPHEWSSAVNTDNQDSLFRKGEIRADFCFKEAVPKKEEGRLPPQILASPLTPFGNPKSDLQGVDDFSLPEKRPEFTDDLEQTLAEIFLTRTPQLSTRSRSRLVSHKNGLPLPSFKEVDDSSLSLTESPPVRQTSPIEGLTPNLNLLRQKRRTRENEYAESAVMQEPVNILQSDSTFESSGKTRQVSGGSQKSVTFSDHVDEHSFLEDLNNPDPSAKSPSMDNHVRDGLTESPELRTTSSPPLNSLNMPGKQSIFLSDCYLALSPLPNKKREDPFTSPLDTKLLSESSLSRDTSMNLSAAVDDLLVPISPDETPSRTPKLMSLRRSTDSIQPSAKEKSSPSSTPLAVDQDSFLGSTVHQTDYFSGLKSEPFPLIEELPCLNLSGLKPTTIGSKTVEMPMSLDLLDEDESILLPASPSIRQEILVDINSPSF